MSIHTRMNMCIDGRCHFKKSWLNIDYPQQFIVFERYIQYRLESACVALVGTCEVVHCHLVGCSLTFEISAPASVFYRYEATITAAIAQELRGLMLGPVKIDLLYVSWSPLPYKFLAP